MKNFLFVTDWINPFEPNFGGAQRSHLLLRTLLQLGNVDVIAFTEGIVSNLEGCNVIYSKRILTPKVSRLKKWCGLLTPWNPYSIFPINEEKEQIIDDFCNRNKYDAIIVRYIAEAMSSGLMKYADRLIIDIDDHPKDALKNNAKQIKSKPNKIYHYLASYLSDITVRNIANTIKATLFSNPEQVIGKRGHFLPNISLHEHNTKYVQFEKTSKRLFFVGLLDHAPNYLGVDWFIENVWMAIKQVLPDAELHIGGKVRYEELVKPYINKWESYEGVKVLGFIEDLSKEYTECRATISPIFIGAGTNIKIIESAQYKRVCITTKCGMRGMKNIFIPGKDVLIASDAQKYAALCIKVLTDESYNLEISRSAYLAKEQHLSHNAFNRVVEQIISK